MLVKLLPEQVAEGWDSLWFGISQALPPIAKNKPMTRTRVLQSLLEMKSECWVNAEDGKINAVLLTTVSEDELSGTRTLLLYALFGYAKITGSDYVEAVELLLRYAKSKGCDTVSAYTNSELLKKIAMKLGGSAEYSLIEFPINLVQKLN